MKYKVGDYVLNIRNNKTAFVEEIENASTYIIRYLDKDSRMLVDDDTVNVNDIKRLKPYKLSIEDAINFLELKITVDDFVPDGNVVDNIVLDGEITNLSSHFLVALKKLRKGITYSKFKPWLTMIMCNTKEFIGRDIENEAKCPNIYSEADILEEAYAWLENIDLEYCDCDYNIDIPGNEFIYSLNIVKYFVEDKNKAIKNKRFDKFFMKDYIAHYNEDSINDASKIEQELFKEFVNRLCKINDVGGLTMKGYCMYCNSVVFPENWKECRDIFEKLYKLTGDPWIANTLGYIYYYGRANKGKPDYNKAFKYFSIGAAGRLYESTYKLADCFKNGYGVVKNEEIAFAQYESVFEDSIKVFRNKQYNYQFADATLRMASCYEKGIGVEESIDDAYYYYLLAELAIDLRVKNHNHYGDSKVSKGIKESLANIRANYKNYRNSIKEYYVIPLFNQIHFERSQRIKADIVKNKDNSYKITLSVYSLPYMKQEDIILSIPEFDYCGFKKNVTFNTSKKSIIKIEGNNKTFMFDDYYYCDEDNTFIFALDGKEIVTLKTEYIEIKKSKIVKGKLIEHI